MSWIFFEQNKLYTAFTFILSFACKNVKIMGLFLCTEVQFTA